MEFAFELFGYRVALTVHIAPALLVVTPEPQATANEPEIPIAELQSEPEQPKRKYIGS